MWFIFLLFIACNEVSTTDRVLLEKLKREEKEKQEKLDKYNRLIQNPNNFITSGSGSVETYNKGILNDYTEIKAYPLKNKSEFTVYDISAEIRVQDKRGNLLGIVPANFIGSLKPGQESKLKISKTTTLQGYGKSYQLTVTKVSADKPIQ